MFRTVALVVKLTCFILNLRPLAISEQKNITRSRDRWLDSDGPFR
ncbi:Uncharacterised protein [Klebsiella pneumoniae]|nr:Uncharacterised protein [Klebsiella pneumoniae]